MVERAAPARCTIVGGRQLTGRWRPSSAGARPAADSPGTNVATRFQRDCCAICCRFRRGHGIFRPAGRLTAYSMIRLLAALLIVSYALPPLCAGRCGTAASPCGPRRVATRQASPDRPGPAKSACRQCAQRCPKKAASGKTTPHCPVCVKQVPKAPLATSSDEAGGHATGRGEVSHAAGHATPTSVMPSQRSIEVGLAASGRPDPPGVIPASHNARLAQIEVWRN